MYATGHFWSESLTRAPELRKTQNDVSVCTFTIACNRRFTNASGQREADFIPIVVSSRAQADNCYRFLKKGRRVGVVKDHSDAYL